MAIKNDGYVCECDFCGVMLILPSYKKVTNLDLLMVNYKAAHGWGKTERGSDHCNGKGCAHDKATERFDNAGNRYVGAVKVSA